MSTPMAGGPVDPLVDGEWLSERLGRPEVCILDCSVANVIHEGGGFELRSGRSNWEAGHIPGSQHVDLLADLSDRQASVPLMMAQMPQIRDALRAAGVADGRHVVVYDNNLNMWAARVWWMLRAVSVEASLLDGGWQSWTLENRPVETGPGSDVALGPLTLESRRSLFVDADEVLGRLGDPATCLIDALQPEVFRGERQDYQRAGHLPGAKNVPFADLVDPLTHRYLPIDQLRARFAATGAAEAARVITYCGGGVAAASAAFTLERLGVTGVAVYDGSMLEWSANPSLPLVTGDA